MAHSGNALAVALLALLATLVADAEVRTTRELGALLPDLQGAFAKGEPSLTSDLEDAVASRDERDAEDEYADYGGEDNGPEGRHFLKHKINRKFKPHKHGHGYGGGFFGGYGCRKHHGCSGLGFGGFGGLGALGGYGGHGGHGGHGHGGHGGYGGPGFGGYGGWQPPPQHHYGGYGGAPVAAAFAGVAPYGGWNPYGSHGGPHGPQGGGGPVASWNLGPFHGTFGLGQAG